MFKKIKLDISSNIFEEFSKSIDFENIINGRKGTILVNNINNLIPIVRTTTMYNKPVQTFLPIHYDIINKIKNKIGDINDKIKKENIDKSELFNIEIKDIEFNNALLEIYDSKYRKMTFHTD